MIETTAKLIDAEDCHKCVEETIIETKQWLGLVKREPNARLGEVE